MSRWRRKRFSSYLAALCAAASAGAAWPHCARAQNPAATAVAPMQTRPAPIVSPEIHPDGTVTFRLRAPKATVVTVGTDWDFKGHDLAKDANGVWTTTIGPVPPDIYSYSFYVDGVTLLDPSNTHAKPMRSETASVLDIPASTPNPWDRVPGTPTGTVHLIDYDSKSLGTPRRLRVYTPPSYDQDPRATFPVLYLLHGSGDNEATWTEYGRANVILDNLIAAEKAKPMIVVMTDGHAGFSLPQAGPDKRRMAFERDFLEDVMPLVESRFRIRADRDSRAIAGLSMGGYQSLSIGLNHRDRFAWVLGMSSDVPNEKSLASFWTDPVSAKEPLRLLWIADGKDDFLLKANQAFDALLTERKVPHEFLETEGRHAWPVWRRDLAIFAPRLFASP